MAQLDSKQRQALEAQVTSLAENVAAALGLEVVLVEIKGGGGRSVVRVYIDQQPGGVTLDDCERFSKRFAVVLEVEDWIPFSYVLEVSSPGLDRPLRKESDFTRFVGKSARVRTRAPREGQRNFKGTIRSVQEGTVGLEVAPDKQIEIAPDDIEKANLVIEI
jgi:ribosome maturation factor RimP